MARPRNRVPSYLHHKASGQAFVRINGRDIYLGRYDSKESKEKFARLIAEHFQNGNSRTIVVPDGDELTVAALAVKYDDHAQSYYRKNGEPTDHLDRIRSSMRQFVKLYGNTPAKQFGPKRLKAVRSAIIDAGSQKKGKKGHPLSRGYVNKLIGCIKLMFQWAVEEELVPPDIFQALSAVRNLRKGRAAGVIEPKPILPVPEEDIPPVLSVVSPQIRAMIEIQRLTGMRPDEVTIMRPTDIKRNNDLWEYRLSTHKTEHHGFAKTILLGPKAQQILIPWLDRDPMSFLFSPKEVMETFHAERRRNRKSPMTPSQSKRQKKRKPIKAPRNHYDDESYCQAVERGCKRAGVRKWTPGQLRHNAGTRVREKFGVEAAQVVLGHQNISTTEIYAEKNRRLYATVMSEVG